MDEIRQILRDKNFKKLFVGDTDNTLIQFFRYLFVGGLAFVVDFALSYIVFRFVFHEQKEFGWIANALSFIAGLVVNYIISTFWIFKTSKVENKVVEFISFAAIGVVGLLITIGITVLFEKWLGDTTHLFQIIAKIVSTAVSFLWNFFARKILLYTKKEK
ncbi:GtrA family protein [Ruminococcus flavefaciens]|uniref:Putative flippase GtrA n=1 Tax=Ruminococcus flavefaciens TaxID=1265 RepID=A0A315Y597_RUMFL|nr:GtrA family protein [Ruminococcus flavefaciens]PWJ15572.1 putative flippase GtrA [Ruminococcus flavefaciens]SSA40813.1 Putative flippase GtrA (transmembrane translocase of bactoprenol-linked glucose) [Ruminococcus flavefaciens]